MSHALVSANDPMRTLRVVHLSKSRCALGLRKTQVVGYIVVTRQNAKAAELSVKRPVSVPAYLGVRVEPARR